MKQKKSLVTHVVIMGDIVGSETAPDRQRLHITFNENITKANKRHRKELASPLTITLGDEFQGLAKSFSAAVEITREMRIALRRDGVACRFVLGAVSIATPVNAKTAWNMMGSGLSETRDMLADKKNPNLYRFLIPEDDVTERLMNAVGFSISQIEKNWTERQFEIAYIDLTSNESAEKKAAKLGISPRVFYKIRKSAELDYYDVQWSTLEFAADVLDKRFGFNK